MEQMRNAYRILARKPEGKRPFGRCRHSWEVDIKMDIKEIEWEDIYWNYLTIGVAYNFNGKFHCLLIWKFCKVYTFK
jgi:hypothetical protein